MDFFEETIRQMLNNNPYIGVEQRGPVSPSDFELSISSMGHQVTPDPVEKPEETKEEEKE